MSQPLSRSRENHLARESAVSPLKALMAGSVAGALARLVTAPLDVVKIRLQLQVTGSAYRGILGTMKTIIQQEGVRALWKGNVPAELLYVVYGGAQFSTYAYVNTQLATWNRGTWLPRQAHSFVAGFAAGCTSTILTYPFDLLRTRLAANQTKAFRSMRGTVKAIYTHERGWRGLYAGMGPALALVCLNTGVMFQAYNWARCVSAKVDLPFAEPICGFMAGAFSKAVTFPLDLLRRRLQVQGVSGRTLGQTVRAVLAVEGGRGFYKGFLVSVLKTAPTSAITLWAYEYVLGLMLPHTPA